MLGNKGSQLQMSVAYVYQQLYVYKLVYTMLIIHLYTAQNKIHLEFNFILLVLEIITTNTVASVVFMALFMYSEITDLIIFLYLTVSEY